MGRPRKSEPTEAVRIPQSLVKRLRVIASHQGKDAGDLIALWIAAPLDQAQAAMLDDLTGGSKPKGKKSQGKGDE